MVFLVVGHSENAVASCLEEDNEGDHGVGEVDGVGEEVLGLEEVHDGEVDHVSEAEVPAPPVEDDVQGANVPLFV